MIDMSNLYSHPDYADTLREFNRKRKWSVFKTVHEEVSNSKCPICECSLNTGLIRKRSNGNKSVDSTIDHYRPKKPGMYPNLKYDHKNYILMCSECNNEYKKAEFPLYPDSSYRNTTAQDTDSITDEQPLVVNPILDKPNDLFKLVFRLSPSGVKILELKPKSNDSYLEKKARETIKLFSLGNWESPDNLHDNDEIQNLRFKVLRDHFVKFYPIVKILNGRKLNELSHKEQNKIRLEVREKKLDEFGFLKSILSQNYVELI